MDARPAFGLRRAALRKVLSPAIACLLLLWIGVVYAGKQSLDLERQEGLRLAAIAQGSAVVERIDGLTARLRAIAGNALVVNATDHIREGHLPLFFRSLVLSGSQGAELAIADDQGQLIISSRPGSQKLSRFPPQLWQRAMQGKETLILVPGSGLFAATPIRSGSGLKGALLMSLDQADVQRLLAPTSDRGTIVLEGLSNRHLTAGQGAATGAVFADPLPLGFFPEFSVRSSVLPQESPGAQAALNVFLLSAFIFDLVVLITSVATAGRLITRPLERLSEQIDGMKQLARVEVLPDAPGEVARLARAFNRSVDCQRALTVEFTTQAAELQQSLVRERELNRIQRDFVAIVSHELRTPIAIIDGSVQRLLRRPEDASPPFIVSTCERIRRAVARLIELIESTVSSARIEAGSITYRPVTLALDGIIEAVCREKVELSHGLKIERDLKGLPAAIQGDRALLHQAFANLITNALNRSSPDRPIKITGVTENGAAAVTVVDWGPSIDPSDIPKLFDRCFRPGGGAGLQPHAWGLPLVKHLIELHGGRVEIDGLDGTGCRIKVILPASHAHTNHPAPKDGHLRFGGLSVRPPWGAKPGDSQREGR